jgi:hypothetical protein
MIKIENGVEVELTPEEIEQVEMDWASMPNPRSQPYRLYRSTFIERMTPEEAETMEGLLMSEGPKLRLMYQAVEYFVSDDPLFAVLHWATAVALGVEGEPNLDRADELLGPEPA